MLWPSATARGDAIVFERNFRIWKLDTASGKAAEVPITRMGAPAGPAVEHLRLTNQFQDLALSPDGKKVAFAARGEIFAASAKDGGDAARVTMTAAPESQVAWSPDSRKLVYSSERTGPARLFLYDFASGKETQLTTDGDGDYAPRFSPDGKSIAFVRGGTELRVLDIEAKKERSLAKGLIADPIQVGRPIAWSPDGKWLAFFTAGTRGFTNVAVVPAAGGEAKPVSFLANANATGVAWSPDGTFLLFDTGQRTEVPQLARVDLILRTPKFREDQFRDLFNEDQSPRRPAAPTAPPADEVPPKPDAAKTRVAAKATEKPEIVFDNIRQRLSLVPTGLEVGEAFISPDGKTVVMIAGAAGQPNLYSWSLDETARERPVAKQLTTTAGAKADVSFTPDSKEVFYLDDGRIQAVNVDKRETPRRRRHRGDGRRLREGEDDRLRPGVAAAARSLLRPGVQRRRLDRGARGGRAVHRRGADAGRDAPHRVADDRRAERVAPRHQRAAGGGRRPAAASAISGSISIARRTSRPAGSRSPASSRSVRPRCRLRRGFGAQGPPARRLPARGGRRAVGRRQSRRAAREQDQPPHRPARRQERGGRRGDRDRRPPDHRRDRARAALPPVGRGAARLRGKASNGRLGYVHMPDMSAGSLAQLYVDLDADNIARDGVVIDVRNNNGGFVNAYALDVLARQPYLNMTQRGAPTAPARSALGQRSLEKPTVLVTNQHSLSDAEDFTEGYRAMKLGKVVGEPTAGWIIFTWNTRLMDGTVLRLPRSRITDRNGAPMEMHPRPVDVEVKRPIGESYGPRDSQLDKAIEVLLAQLR